MTAPTPKLPNPAEPWSTNNSQSHHDTAKNKGERAYCHSAQRSSQGKKYFDLIIFSPQFDNKI